MSLLLTSVLLQADEPAVNLTVETHLGGGYFSELTKVVDNLICFKKQRLNSIAVDWSAEFFPYKDAPSGNGWEFYFEPIVVPPQEGSKKTVRSGSHCDQLHDFTCTDQWVKYDDYLPYRLAVHRVVQEHIKIKPHILARADQIYREKMEGNYCIGVHVRFAGVHSAEVGEKRTPTLIDYLSEVERIVKERGSSRTKVVLATDSNYVVKQFKKKISEKNLVVIDAFRATFNEDPHMVYEHTAYCLAHPEEFHKKKPGYKGGEDVLVDCLLLSRCDTFIHASSNVAAFVTFFNPHIGSIFLPKGIAPKPCHHRTLPPCSSSS
jgi:hypothetical protein